MATNPMQRKARNSFLGGMLVMLVIAMILGVGGFFLFSQYQKTKKNERGTEIQVYVLNKSVESGEVIKETMLTKITTYSNLVPTNYIDGTVINKIKTTDATKQVIAKVDMTENTVLTNALVTTTEDSISNDVRLAEYNMLTLPTTINLGDYIDIRLTLPNGQDFIVVSKEKVISINGETIGLYLSEEQILMMNSAIVETYIMKASNIYAVQYVEAGMQKAAVQTYVPTAEVEALIKADSNIVEDAKNALLNRFDSGIRNYINTEKDVYLYEKQENIETGIKEQIEKAKKAREEYLTGLQETNQ